MVESKNTELSQGTWLNKPKSVFQEAGKVTLETDEKTDFWRETFYGFTRDSGHFLGVETVLLLHKSVFREATRVFMIRLVSWFV